jgi:hypothetical protein
MADEAPKSSYELAMERLRKKDKDAGIEERAVTGEQREEIAEIRRVYEARLAEREILYQAAVRKARDEDSLAVLEEEYRKDRERVGNERDKKIEEARNR